MANSGARVSSLSLTECEEIYRVRERVEPLLLRMSAPGLATDARPARGLAEQMAGTADPEEFLALDRAFHLGTYAGADTVVLTDLVHRLWNRTQAYRRVYTALMDESARHGARRAPPHRRGDPRWRPRQRREPPRRSHPPHASPAGQPPEVFAGTPQRSQGNRMNPIGFLGIGRMGAAIAGASPGRACR